MGNSMGPSRGGDRHRAGGGLVMDNKAGESRGAQSLGHRRIRAPNTLSVGSSPSPGAAHYVWKVLLMDTYWFY